MNIKFQKILMFIPFIGFVVCGFSWIASMIRCVDGMYHKNTLLTILKCFGVVILVNIPHMILSKLLEPSVFLTIVFWVITYATLFLACLVLIRAQEKILAEYEKKLEKWNK